VRNQVLSRLAHLLSAGPAAWQWTCLLGLSIGFVLVLELARVPAALLLGPMLAAILVAASGAGIRPPRKAFVAAQAVIGCMIARGIPLSIGGEIMRDWPLFVAGVLSVVAAANVIGLLLTLWRFLPGTTAIWGSAPGAASAMIIMADAYGADVRLVAVMQYLRVVCVAVAASVVSRLWGGATGPGAAEVVWFPAIDAISFVETIALAGLGALIGRRLRIPAGSLVVPLVAGVLLQGFGIMTIVLPPWLLALSYAFVGWSVGLRFTRPILVYALRALPRVLASIAVLIVCCALFAAVLVVAAGVDPLTAYLATNPGGADSVAIIAVSTPVDVPFVMAMQTARLMVVLLTGPGLARLIAERTGIRDKRSSRAAADGGLS
jgi:membrane AbrB-like protein